MSRNFKVTFVAIVLIALGVGAATYDTLVLKNAGSLVFKESQGNGGDKTTVSAAGGLSSDITVTLPNTTSTLATAASVTAKADLAGDDFTGTINLLTENELRLQDASGGEYVGFKAPATVTGSQTYTLPPADGTAGQVFKTDGAGNTAWSDDGGGGGAAVSYFDDFEADTVSNVVEYDDVSAAVDLTGGSPNVTSSSETTNELSGSASYKLSKDAADRVDEGWAITSNTLERFETVGPQNISIYFAYETSANYVSGDIEMFTYRVGSNTLEACNTQSTGSPANDLPAAPDGALYECRLTVDSTDTSFRLGFHVDTTNANAYDIVVDRIDLSITGVVVGFNSTPWESFTPTGTWTTNTTYTGMYRRNGDSLDMRVHLALAGAPNSVGNLEVDLPTGLTMASAKLVGNSHEPFGIVSLRDITVGTFQGSALYADSNTIRVHAYADNTTFEGAGTVNQTTPFTFASGDFIDIEVKGIPIEGWKDSNLLSTHRVDTQTVRAIYTRTSAGSANTTIADNTFEVMDYNVKVEDTHNAVTTGASWKFEPPRDGAYTFSLSGAWANTTNLVLTQVDVRCTLAGNYIMGGGSSTDLFFTGASTTIPLVKGDDCNFQVYQDDSTSAARTPNTTANINNISIVSEPDFSHVGVNGVFELLQTDNPTLANYLTTGGNWGDLDSLDLSPGTWEITGTVTWRPAGSTNTNTWEIGIGTTSGNNAPGTDTFQYTRDYKSLSSGELLTMKTGPYIVTITEETTHYLKSNAISTITNLQTTHSFQAKRLK